MPNTVSPKYYVKLVNVYYQMVRKTQIVLNNNFNEILFNYFIKISFNNLV